MGLSVAVTGTASFFGYGLLLALEADPEVERILALDTVPPPGELEKTTYRRIDVIHPRSGEQLANVLERSGTEVLVHSAFLARPTHRGGWAHELEAIGTRNVLAAAEAAGTPRLVLRSTTLAYGALPDNPNYLPETAPLRGGAHSRFLADKAEAEAQTARFAQQNPERTVTVLRFAPLLGPTADTLPTAYFSRRMAPTLLGYDPLIQLIHEEDAIEAARSVVHRPRRGVFNVAAPGVIPIARAIRLAGGRAVPLPSPAVRSMAETLWAAQIGTFSPDLLDFLRYLCVADTRRMQEELGFSPRYDVRETILSFAGARRIRQMAA